MSDCKYNYLLAISQNNFVVDTVEISCPKMRRKGRRSDTFIELYCKKCSFECKGRLLVFE